VDRHKVPLGRRGRLRHDADGAAAARRLGAAGGGAGGERAPGRGRWKRQSSVRGEGGRVGRGVGRRAASEAESDHGKGWAWFAVLFVAFAPSMSERRLQRPSWPHDQSQVRAPQCRQQVLMACKSSFTHLASALVASMVASGLFGWCRSQAACSSALNSQ
jgi:hypothetical protein